MTVVLVKFKSRQDLFFHLNIVIDSHCSDCANEWKHIPGKISLIFLHVKRVLIICFLNT